MNRSVLTSAGNFVCPGCSTELTGGLCCIPLISGNTSTPCQRNLMGDPSAKKVEFKLICPQSLCYIEYPREWLSLEKGNVV